MRTILSYEPTYRPTLTPYGVVVHFHNASAAEVHVGSDDRYSVWWLQWWQERRHSLVFCWRECVDAHTQWSDRRQNWCSQLWQIIRNTRIAETFRKQPKHSESSIAAEGRAANSRNNIVQTVEGDRPIRRKMSANQPKHIGQLGKTDRAIAEALQIKRQRTSVSWLVHEFGHYLRCWNIAFVKF